jgi:hypothetical protein
MSRITTLSLGVRVAQKRFQLFMLFPSKCEKLLMQCAVRLPKKDSKIAFYSAALRLI